METKKYFFRPGKASVKQGFFMQDENEEVVYEANVLKMPVLSAADVEFVNKINGRSEIHKVGHTMTTETSGLLGPFRFMKSYFKYDGEKIWDYLHDQGIRIESGIQSERLGMSYDVTLKGNKIANISTAAADGSKFILTTRFTLDVTTTEEFIDWAFLVAYSIAKTEQTFYN